jgi:hypothetical protein
MLAREQWTKPSLEDFIAWLETKPHDEEYVWVVPSVCPCGQYAKSLNLDWWEIWIGRNISLWDELNTLASHKPRTFGALLTRALAVKAKARASR